MIRDALGSIAVVEADDAVRNSLHALLVSHGYAVECYGNAEQFLKHFQWRPQCLLIVDAELPVMSGLELLERLQADGRHLPVIMLASQGSVPMTVRAMRAGAGDFLEKPFFQSALIKRIGELLEGA